SLRQGSGTGTALTNLPATTSLSTAVPASEGLQPGQTYAWNVTACNDASHCSSLNPTWFTFATQATNATLTSPAPNSTLAGGSVPCSWTSGSGADQYSLWAGKSPGTYEYGALYTSATSITATYLPVDGSLVYVRLWTHYPSGWGYRDYTFTAVTGAA